MGLILGVTFTVDDVRQKIFKIKPLLKEQEQWFGDENEASAYQDLITEAFDYMVNDLRVRHYNESRFELDEALIETTTLQARTFKNICLYKSLELIYSELSNTSEDKQHELMMRYNDKYVNLLEVVQFTYNESDEEDELVGININKVVQ